MTVDGPLSVNQRPPSIWHTLANAPGAASAETLYETVLRAIGDGYVGSVFTRMKKTFGKVAKFVDVPV